MGKVHVFMCLHIASIKSIAGSKTISPFRISNSSALTLAEAFRSDHVAACSTALRSATEENESCGYVTVPCPSNVTQHSSTAYSPNFHWRRQIGYDGTHTEQIFTFKVTLCNSSCNSYCKLVDTVNFDLNYCKSHLKKVDFYTD